MIGIPKAKQVLKEDGSLKNLKHVKLMVNRFLDYFGLECKQKEKTETNRIYAITTPKVFENFPDIDICLEARVKAVIELAATVSLKEVVDKAEGMQQQMKEAEEKYHASATRRQPSPNSQSLRPAGSVSLLFNKTNKNTASHTSTDNIPSTDEAWFQPENIAEVVEMLDFCEDAETLALIRRGSIPPFVFKVAARSLSHGKREQIRQWVTAQNAA